MADGYVIKDNKCLKPVDINISYGTALPDDSEGNDGDIFILIGDE